MGESLFIPWHNTIITVGYLLIESGWISMKGCKDVKM